mmetsp:Transcript_105157/g.322416  ORF Transcript_105157/g.322416 Transcript_105157/m.322416 type:complete len:229 (-) Transcript_105157:366-1052(-)
MVRSDEASFLTRVPLALASVEKQLLHLLHIAAYARLLNPQNVILREAELFENGGAISVEGPMVREEDIHRFGPWVCGLRFKPAEKVRHEAFGPYLARCAPHRGLHGLLLVQLNEKQLHWGPPVHGPTIGHGGGARARRRQRRRRKEPRERLRRRHVEVAARRLGIRPRAVVGQVPPGHALHLARPVPGDHHCEVRDPAPSIAPAPGVGLPLGACVRLVGHGETLEDLY